MTHMPQKEARMDVNIRGPVRESIHLYMCGEITCADDLLDAVEGDEETPVVIDTVIAMAGGVIDSTPMLVSPTYSDANLFQSKQATKTKLIDTARNAEAIARIQASKTRSLPAIQPTSEWIGGEWAGAFPINTGVERFHPSVVENGVHVLDLFAGITCAGLRIVLSAGLKVKCYTSVEIDECSRAISNEVLSKLQLEYPH